MTLETQNHHRKHHVVSKKYKGYRCQAHVCTLLFIPTLGDCAKVIDYEKAILVIFARKISQDARLEQMLVALVLIPTRMRFRVRERCVDRARFIRIYVLAWSLYFKLLVSLMLPF